MSVLLIIEKFKSILSKHQKLRIIELAVLMLAGGFLEMCSVSLMIPFVNAVMDPERMMHNRYIKIISRLMGLYSAQAFLAATAAALVLLYILKNVYLLFEINLQYRFVYGNMLDMQKKMLDLFVHRPYEYFLKIDSGEVIRMINHDIPEVFNLLSVLLSMFTEIVVSGMLIITVFLITPAATICMAVVFLAMLYAVNRILKPALAKSAKANLKAYAGMNKWLLQSIQGIKELKVMSKEKYFQDHYSIFGELCVQTLRKRYVYGMIPRYLIEAVSMSTMFIVIAVMINSGIGMETIVPMLSAVAMAAVRLLPSINKISLNLTSMAYNEPMLDELLENLKAGFGMDSGMGRKTEYEKLDMESSGSSSWKLEKEILFDRITYSYPDSNVSVLREASMCIKKGEAAGIAGASGAGKTTSADIMLGLLKPDSGSIYADGKNIFQDLDSWLLQVGYIPQTIFMLDDSIRANVAFGVESQNVQDDAVWMALEEAALAEFVKSLPEGIDTQIGERGVRLSGGQRQRIGIARALYRNPSILVFDEATSALDYETESAIMESIQKLKGQKTMIIIAHRLSTMESCNHIYRVENGKFVLER